MSECSRRIWVTLAARVRVHERGQRWVGTGLTLIGGGGGDGSSSVVMVGGRGEGRMGRPRGLWLIGEAAALAFALPELIAWTAHCSLGPNQLRAALGMARLRDHIATC